MDDPRLKRLHYQSWHRGCKETDIILGRFADEHLSHVSADMLGLYEQLLDEDDADIWKWLTGKDVPEKYARLITMLIAE